LPIFIVLATASIVIYLHLSRRKKTGGGNWIQFYTRGKDVGFSLKEVELLRQLAVKCNLEDPNSLFWSQNQFDICIRAMIRGIKASGEGESQETHDFLAKLFDYRKNIEMNKPKNKHGISNSRQISEGQWLRVLASGSGVYKSQVVKNTSQYLTISRPVNNRNSTSSAWEGSKISVYFWRVDDAGYVFDSTVQDEIFSKGILALKIAHSESLFRTQKRKSIRIKFQKPAYLYLVTEGSEPYKLEEYPGLKCFLDDISDTGCAVYAAGKADPGLRVKIQFSLDNAPICMTGTIRSTSYSEETGRSRLHIEADNLPVENRNRILAEVLGMQSDEDEEELPFRDLDDEAASIGSKNSLVSVSENSTLGNIDIGSISRDFELD